MAITYTPNAFAPKNLLPPGDPNKLLDGAEFDTEFNAISTALASAAVAASPTFSGTATFDVLTTTGDVTVGGDLTVTGSVIEDTSVNVALNGSYALGSGTSAMVFHTANGNITYSDSLVEGQTITLMVKPDTYTVTWPTVKWVGGIAPSLDTANHNIISLWKVNSVLFGSWGGSVDAS